MMVRLSPVASHPRSAWFTRTLIALICLGLLYTGVVGDHLHVCLDGSGGEPAASVHAAHDGVHHTDLGDADAHHDVDLRVAGHALVQKAGLSLDVFALAVFVVTLPFYRPHFTRVRQVRGVDVPLFVNSAILPPLRAPPR